jgi:micrococcal nuclease
MDSGAAPAKIKRSGGLLNVPVSGTGGDRDCSDFGSQGEAQRFFIANGGPASDPHKLDRDDDGIACES